MPCFFVVYDSVEYGEYTVRGDSIEDILTELEYLVGWKVDIQDCYFYEAQPITYSKTVTSATPL